MFSNQPRTNTTPNVTIKTGNPSKTKNEASINIISKKKQIVYNSLILINANNYEIELNNDEHFDISKNSNKKQKYINLTHKYEQDISDLNNNNDNDPQYHGEGNDDEQDKLKGNTPIKQKKINH